MSQIIHPYISRKNFLRRSYVKDIKILLKKKKKKKDCGRSQNFTEEDKDKKRQKQRPFVY